VALLSSSSFVTIAAPSSNEKVALLNLERMVKEERSSRSEGDFVALLQVDDDDMSSHNQLWRERVAQWFYDVLDYLEESRDVAYVAMNVLDRYLAVLSTDEPPLMISSIQPFDFEVMAFTSLFLAIRVCGSNTDLQVPELLQLSTSGAQPRHILAAGNNMLQKLSWNCRVITPFAILKDLHELLVQQWNSSQNSRRLADLTPEQANSLLEFASYLVEVSVCDSYFSCTPPSQVACAALTLACMSEQSTFGALLEFLPRFFEVLCRDISLDLDSVQMKPVVSRLFDVYTQSHEAAASAAADAPAPAQVPVDIDETDGNTLCLNIIFDQEVPAHNDILLNVLEQVSQPEQAMRPVSPMLIDANEEMPPIA
jgi:hypothetical protein